MQNPIQINSQSNQNQCKIQSKINPQSNPTQSSIHNPIQINRQPNPKQFIPIAHPMAALGPSYGPIQSIRPADRSDEPSKMTKISGKLMRNSGDFGDPSGTRNAPKNCGKLMRNFGDSGDPSIPWPDPVDPAGRSLWRTLKNDQNQRQTNAQLRRFW